MQTDCTFKVSVVNVLLLHQSEIVQGGLKCSSKGIQDAMREKYEYVVDVKYANWFQLNSTFCSLLLLLPFACSMLMKKQLYKTFELWFWYFNISTAAYSHRAPNAKQINQIVNKSSGFFCSFVLFFSCLISLSFPSNHKKAVEPNRVSI